MNDKQFLSVLNAVSRDHALALPMVEVAESPSGELLHAWAQFVEACIERGVDVGDPRWQRVSLAGDTPHTQFALKAAETTATERDADFRVGLQLLLSLLGRRDK